MGVGVGVDVEAPVWGVLVTVAWGVGVGVACGVVHPCKRSAERQSKASSAVIVLFMFLISLKIFM